MNDNITAYHMYHENGNRGNSQLVNNLKDEQLGKRESFLKIKYFIIIMFCILKNLGEGARQVTALLIVGIEKSNILYSSYQE